MWLSTDRWEYKAMIHCTSALRTLLRDDWLHQWSHMYALL